MNRPRILVAGIGNIFLGDDAFGVEVARRLGRHELPDAVRVADFGIRGLDLAYALLDGYEGVILVDAAPRGGPPGTLYVLELPSADVSEEPCAGPIEAHGMDPTKVLRLAWSMGARVDRLLLVGCEPARGADEAEAEMPMEMSEPVRTAVDEAVALTASLVRRLLAGGELGEDRDGRIPGKEVGTWPD